jgi:type III secretory pathway component EscT
MAHEIRVNKVYDKEKQKSLKRQICESQPKDAIKLSKPITVTMLLIILFIYYISFFSERMNLSNFLLDLRKVT